MLGVLVIEGEGAPERGWLRFCVTAGMSLKLFSKRFSILHDHEHCHREDFRRGVSSRAGWFRFEDQSWVSVAP